MAPDGSYRVWMSSVAGLPVAVAFVGRYASRYHAVILPLALVVTQAVAPATEAAPVAEAAPATEAAHGVFTLIVFTPSFNVRLRKFASQRTLIVADAASG